MIEVLDDFPEELESWGRLFYGECNEILLPHPAKDWVWTNPSILRGDNPDEYLCAIRLTGAWWKYNPSSILTIARMNEVGVPHAIKQLNPPENDRELVPDAPIIHNGPHDCRLFRVNGQLFGTATIWDNTKECVIEPDFTLGRIALIQISDELKWLKTTMLPSLFNDVEKNWMPIDGEFSWLYLPTQNIFATYSADTRKFRFRTEGRIPDVMEFSRGSTQLIDIGDNKLLGIVHDIAEPVYQKRNWVYRLRYAHKFALYDKTTKDLLGISPLFYFLSPNCVEFATGLTLTHDGERLIASFGYHDVSAWLATADLDAVLATIDLFSDKNRLTIFDAQQKMQ